MSKSTLFISFRINEFETKVKAEDAVIENYQKELKYLATLKEKQ